MPEKKNKTAMAKKELLAKTTEQLKTELSEARKHLFTLRSQAVTEKLEDPSQLGKTRRAIARMMGEQNKRRTAAVAK